MQIAAAKRKRAPRIDSDVIAEIHSQALAGKTNGEIARGLAADPRFDNRVPQTDKTIRKYADEIRPTDPSDPWSIASDETGEPGAVLAALAAAIVTTGGKTAAIARSDAAVIANLSRGAPDMPALTMWRLARLYVARGVRGEAVADLDAFVALGPWRDPQAFRDYLWMANEGIITRAPRFLTAGEAVAGIDEDSLIRMAQYERSKNAELQIERRARSSDAEP